MHDLRFIPTREIMRDWSFITCDVGPPFSRGGGGGNFHNLDWFGGKFSEVREHYLGVILVDFMKVVQSSNECQLLKLNVTDIKINTDLKNTTVDKVCGELHHNVWLEYL